MYKFSNSIEAKKNKTPKGQGAKGININLPTRKLTSAYSTVRRDRPNMLAAVFGILTCMTRQDVLPQFLLLASCHVEENRAHA